MKTEIGSFIPNVLLYYRGISPAAKLLWARLVQYEENEGKIEGYPPSLKMLAEEFGITERQIRRLLKQLVSNDFLEQKYMEKITVKTKNRRWK